MKGLNEYRVFVESSQKEKKEQVKQIKLARRNTEEDKLR